MLGIRLKQLRKEKQITQANLAEDLNITQQAVAKWEAGKAAPDKNMLLRLAEYFKVSIDFLFGRNEKIVGPSLPAPNLVSIPILGSVKAGYGSLAYEDYQGSETADVKKADEYFYFEVKGDSMYPQIKQGDLALVRRQPTLENGDLGVFIYGDGEATLKKFLIKKGSVYLEPFNREYRTLVISNEDLNNLYIFGKVVETKTRW